MRHDYDKSRRGSILNVLCLSLLIVACKNPSTANKYSKLESFDSVGFDGKFLRLDLFATSGDADSFKLVCHAGDSIYLDYPLGDTRPQSAGFISLDSAKIPSFWMNDCVPCDDYGMIHIFSFNDSSRTYQEVQGSKIVGGDLRVSNGNKIFSSTFHNNGSVTSGLFGIEAGKIKFFADLELSRIDGNNGELRISATDTLYIKIPEYLERNIDSLIEEVWRKYPYITSKSIP